MAITRNIVIDGREVPFKASAAIPRYYRFRFGRDIFKDLTKLMEAINRSSEEGSTLDIPSLEIFENVAYMMAKYADPGVPDTPEEWLDGFETFSIYQVLPQLLTLWGMNMEAQIESKKKLDRLTAN